MVAMYPDAPEQKDVSHTVTPRSSTSATVAELEMLSLTALGLYNENTTPSCRSRLLDGIAVTDQSVQASIRAEGEFGTY